jgi:hypothetical protein
MAGCTGPAGRARRRYLTVPIFSNPEVLMSVMAHTPLGRLPEVEEIASAILLCAARQRAALQALRCPSTPVIWHASLR